MVRVDFFTRHGKWHTTEEVKWLTYDPPDYTNGVKTEEGKDTYESFIEALVNHFKDSPSRLSEMVAVCLEPYHKWSFPLMVVDWFREEKDRAIYRLEIKSRMPLI